MKYKIYLTEPASDILYDYVNNNHIITNNLYESDIAIVRNNSINKEDIDKSKNLKLIAVHGTGYNMVDIEYANKKNILCFNIPNLNTNAVAELNLMLMLMLARSYNKTIKTKKLGDIEAIGSELKNKTVGFIGVGHIALATAKLLQAFNVELIGYNRTKKDTIIRLKSFDYVLNNSDYIILSIALNDDTRKMINMDALKKMKKNPYLINTARGAIIDNDALLYALKNNIIKGFGADVFDPEPISDDNPILKYNSIVLPHIGANTKEALDDMAKAVIKGIEAFINGGIPDNVLKS
jgi:phosphoglycerate dehydrogenase-like enzyme